MIPHKQLFLHKPEEGQLGDCYRTAIACLLEREPGSVPHHYGRADMSDSEVRALMQAWLAEQGLCSVQVCFGGSDLATVMGFMGSRNPGLYYMLSGTSPRGTCHVVICLGNQMVHDPHPDGTGLAGPMEGDVIGVEFLVPAFHLAREAAE